MGEIKTERRKARREMLQAEAQRQVKPDTGGPQTSIFHINSCNCLFHFLKDFTYLFLEIGEGREKERESNIDQLPLTWPQLGTWPTTQACALTRNQTSDLSICRLMLNPLSHTSQGINVYFNVYLILTATDIGFYLW